MNLTYYGHGCILVEVEGKNILFDPFITHNPLAGDIDVNTIPADYILLTHGHEDHVADALSIAQRTEATIVSNFEIVSWYAATHGYKKGHPMNHGGQWQFDFGKVRYTTAIHSSVLPDGAYGGNPGGFLITTPSESFYIAGDTALTYDMKLIPLWAKINFAVLPIGDNFTMGIDDAVIASEFIECDKIVGIHYDTFGFIKIDKDYAKEAFAKKGKELHLPGIGETINI